MNKDSFYSHINIHDYMRENTPHQMREPADFYRHVSEISSNGRITPKTKAQQFAEKSEHLNQKELTRLEAEALYWKLLAPLNYKMLEGKYILVCPICDKDLGLSQDRMVYRRHFELEALYGKKTQKTHIAECEVIAEA